MRSSSHTLDPIEVVFDDDHLVADAGLILATALAQHLGLRELFERHVAWATPRGGPTWATRP